MVALGELQGQNLKSTQIKVCGKRLKHKYSTDQCQKTAKESTGGNQREGGVDKFSEHRPKNNA